MLSRIALRGRIPARIPTTPRPLSLQLLRTLTSAPQPGDGPLLERRSDRELPNVSTTSHWRRTLPIFAVLVASASVAIFNYQKLSSPVVSGTLYALRTSPRAREALGDEIYFAAQIPWIGGGMNQLHGKIDIRFDVKGTRGKGTMRFVSSRPTPRGVFETSEWSLEMEDGRKIDLLEEGDPFRALMGGGDGLGEEEEVGAAATRGYRQMK